MEVDGEKDTTTTKKAVNRSRSRSKSRQGGRIQKNSHRKASASVVFPKKVKLLGASKKQK